MVCISIAAGRGRVVTHTDQTREKERENWGRSCLAWQVWAKGLLYKRVARVRQNTLCRVRGKVGEKRRKKCPSPSPAGNRPCGVI